MFFVVFIDFFYFLLVVLSRVKGKVYKDRFFNLDMWWIFGAKKEIDDIKKEVTGSFSNVKNDIDKVSKWIKHLDSQDVEFRQDILDLKELLSTVQEDVEGLKNTFALLNLSKVKGLSRQLSNKQTAVQGVENPVYTAVETAVQSDFLDVLSAMERAVVYVLVNTDMKLSYDDLAAMLGKERSTVRSQVNHIRQKVPGLVDEIIEKNGKKRVFIPDQMKGVLLKKARIRKKARK